MENFQIESRQNDKKLNERILIDKPNLIIIAGKIERKCYEEKLLWTNEKNIGCDDASASKDKERGAYKIYLRNFNC